MIFKKLFKNHTNHKLRGKWYSQKPIEQYKDGILINTYNSATEIQRKKGYSKGHISECCNGKRKTVHGYEWRYKEPLVAKDIIKTTKYKEALKQIKWRLEYSVISKDEMLEIINNALGE